jgi:hypothetical protein
MAGNHGDVMIAVEPDPELVRKFDAAGGTGKRRYGQMAICDEPDPDAAIARAHQQFRWFGAGWKVNSELPGPASFAQASAFVRAEHDRGGAVRRGVRRRPTL